MTLSVIKEIHQKNSTRLSRSLKVIGTNTPGNPPTMISC